MKLNTIFRSAWFQMKHQKVLSIVTIAGTSLAIFLIMIVVMMQEVLTAPFAPESNRDRFLHYKYLSSYKEEWGEGNGSNGPLSYNTAKQMLLSLETPEAATAYRAFTAPAAMSIPKGENVQADFRPVDDNFWKVFDFTFIDGKPFTKADFDAGRPEIVITESVARKVFGTTEVAGREILMNLAPFRVAGVVKDVSTLADACYAQVWPNLSATASMNDTWGTIHGPISVTLLAHSRDDFAKIKDEYNKAHDRYEGQLKSEGWKILSRNRPYDQETQVVALAANIEPDLPGERRRRLIIYLILLIVPAINLSSMTQSRLKQRTAEIGVRRSFGCTRGRIIADIITENLAMTLVAGIIGLLLSVIFGYLCNSLLFAQPYSMTFNPPKVDSSILFHWSTFGWAMLFCFILNLLSSGLPAFNASRTSLVNALSGRSK